MDDVQGLYIVTAVVLVGLFGWVAAVLARAPNAVDESKRPPPAAVVRAPAPSGEHGPERLLPTAPEIPPETPVETPPEPAPKAAVAREVAIIVADEPPKAAASPPEAPAPGALPRVVVLPPIRQRLDSHSEIQDSPANAPIILMPGGDTSDRPRGRLALVTAIGRSEPGHGKQPERDAHVEKDGLFVFADGSGRKAGAELVGAIAVESLTQVFAKDEASPKTDDPKLPPRANRVRRAVLATNTLLLKRARAMAFAGLGASAFVAHFSPSNEELFVARAGQNRAYRLRGGELTLLTSAHGKRQVGLTERVEVEVVSLTTQPDDLYLFCSEGLALALGDGLAAALTAGSSLEETTKRLIAFLDTKQDARDLLAILVRVESTSPVIPTPAPTARGLG